MVVKLFGYVGINLYHFRRLHYFATFITADQSPLISGPPTHYSWINASDGRSKMGAVVSIRYEPDNIDKVLVLSYLKLVHFTTEHYKISIVLSNKMYLQKIISFLNKSQLPKR